MAIETATARRRSRTATKMKEILPRATGDQQTRGRPRNFSRRTHSNQALTMASASARAPSTRDQTISRSRWPHALGARYR